MVFGVTLAFTMLSKIDRNINEWLPSWRFLSVDIDKIEGFVDGIKYRRQNLLHNSASCRRGAVRLRAHGRLLLHPRVVDHDIQPGILAFGKVIADG